jgi:phosphate transport system protein
MEHHFDLEIEALKNKLLLMGGQAEASARKALDALLRRDDSAARAVIAEDSRIDRLEMEVDEMAVQLLSKAPLARDLRLIIVALKISHDLERVGDEATTMARRAIELNCEPQLKPAIDLPRMAARAFVMLDDSLDAFVQRDSAKARAVIAQDKEVDRLNKQFHRELSTFMTENSHAIPRALNLMVICKALERIADHAKNVAEEVVFLHEGHDIRHLGGQTPPENL